MHDKACQKRLKHTRIKCKSCENVLSTKIAKASLLSTMSFTCQANKQWFDTVGTEFPGFLPLPLLPSGLCSCHFGWLCWWYYLSRCPGVFKKVTSAGIYCAVHASSNLPYKRCAGLNMVFKNGYVQKKVLCCKTVYAVCKVKSSVSSAVQ